MIILPVLAELFYIKYVTPVFLLAFAFGILTMLLRGKSSI